MQMFVKTLGQVISHLESQQYICIPWYAKTQRV